MNRIDQRFADLAQRGEAAFIPYIVAGDPTIEKTKDIVRALEESGADIIEFGVPFSDPVADGVANQEGALRALKHNTSLKDVIALVAEIRKESEIPILLFTYYNPVLAYGHKAFARDCAEAGVDGVLCVDLPPDEASDYAKLLNNAGICTVFLATPTSHDDRIKLISKKSTGFVYYVSRTGVTGERDQLLNNVKSMVESIKAASNKPVAVGFGISKPEHAAEVASYADGVVVGSAIVRLIGEYGDSPDLTEKLKEFVGSLASATKQATPEAAKK